MWIDRLEWIGHLDRMPALLTGKQVAELLDLDPKTLRKYVREGVCPVAPLPGMKPPRWRAADVVTFIGER